MYALVYEKYRRGLVRRFPYAVFYEYAWRYPSFEVAHQSINFRLTSFIGYAKLHPG
jgi:hypothetical protein